MAKNDIPRAHGGKADGLELLLQHTNLGYRVPHYETIGMEFFDEILGQRAKGDVATLISQGILKEATRYVPTSLPRAIRTRLKTIAAGFKGTPRIVCSNSRREGGTLSFRGRYESRRATDNTLAALET